MAQTMILPGTYVEVRAEGLITTGAIATGNIGVVGTACKGEVDRVYQISSLAEAKEIFGDQDESGELTLVRSLDLIYQNGGTTVFAVRTAKGAVAAQYIIPSSGLVLQAKSPGTWANSFRVKIALISKQNEPQLWQVSVTRDSVEESYQVGSAKELQEQMKASQWLELVKQGKEDTELKAIDLEDTDLAAASTLGTNGTLPDQSVYKTSLQKLENVAVNIVLLAGQDPEMLGVLQGHLKATAQIKRERIGIIGSKTGETPQTLKSVTAEDGRLVYCAPGIRTTDSKLFSGAYTAAAIAGLLSSLSVKTSPTNKPLILPGLEQEFNTAELETLVQKNVLVVENRNGYRVVKGITTDEGAWKQITTRRIVDYAIYGVRSGCDPYIGKLNNERVRGAMKATLDAFLTGMVQDEALESYELSVSATRDEEKAGKVRVIMTLKPTFSIDYIQVTLYLN